MVDAPRLPPLASIMIAQSFIDFYSFLVFCIPKELFVRLIQSVLLRFVPILFGFELVKLPKQPRDSLQRPFSGTADLVPALKSSVQPAKVIPFLSLHIKLANQMPITLLHHQKSNLK